MELDFMFILFSWDSDNSFVLFVEQDSISIFFGIGWDLIDFLEFNDNFSGDHSAVDNK